MTRVAVVINGLKADEPEGEAVRAAIRAATDAAGWPEPSWLITTEDDPGRGQTEKALRDGAELVVVAGGDGTVSCCAAALAGTGVPMAVVPMGTGNLIVRNLGLPSDVREAADLAVAGEDRAIDVGRCGDRVVVAMAGVGLDAAMIADAPPKLKKRWGWPAYAVSIARHLADRGFPLTMVLDGRPYQRRKVRALVIGNMGRLQGGVHLLPDAHPTTGVLDVVVLAPFGLLGWIPVFARVLARRRGSTAGVERFQARHVVVHTDGPEQQEIDGEALGTGTDLDVEVVPGGLVVRVPRT